MTIESNIRQCVVEGNARQISALVAQALADGLAPIEVLNQALIPAMGEVGRRFECGEFYLQEMLVAARAMKAGVAVLAPLLKAAEVKPIGTVILGTVKGDLHDIGKSLVGMMLECMGFAVTDLGVDVPPERFVAAVKDHRPDIVGLSALLTTTMPAMKATLEALAAAQLRDAVKVIVGGAPVTEQYAEAIGADGYAPDAARAAKWAIALATRRDEGASLALFAGRSGSLK